MNSNVEPESPLNQSALRGDSPSFNVRLKKIRVLLEKDSNLPVAVILGEVRRANQAGNAGGQRRWGIPAIFLPTLLLGGWPMPDQKPGGGLHHWIGVEIPKRSHLPKAP